MHELPVTEGILKTAIDAAQQNGGRRTTAIDLVIGELSSIVDDSVQFYFDILSKGTLAEGARLHFQRQSAIAVCLDCQHEFVAHAPFSPTCPNCDGVRLQIKGGREFYVDSIEVEDEDSSR